ATDVIHAILTDIEGTTTDIAFVHEVLFPYARAHIGDFVRTHAQDPAVRDQIEAVAAEVGEPLSVDQTIGQLLRWIDEDKKITPLKALQGMIWETGYKAGDFQGHVYPDAEKNLRAWHAAGKKLYVYSSGSVQAQKLLFGYTPYGDLTPLFSGYFDTRIGQKRAAASYERIRKSIGRPAGEFLFLSDIGEELDAALAAGMQTCWLMRDRKPDPTARHRQVQDFDAIQV
ncbi:MAG: acireductone synthase, partial [Chromatiales bacterium]